MLLPKDMQEQDELGGNMSASSIAKANTMFAKQITQWCKEANIIFITINHILDDINMSFIPKAAQISGLKQGERLPASKTMTYLANNMFRVDDTNTLKATEGFGIDGSIVRLTIIKSRTNTSKKSIPLIFNKSEGKFDEILSLFQLLKDEGVLNGSGSFLFFKELPDEKFAQRTFKEKMMESTELQKAFINECMKILTTYLSDTKIKQRDDAEMKLNENLINMFDHIANSELYEYISA